jgi:transcriptional regulator with XRE-family HTH domain
MQSKEENSTKTTFAAIWETMTAVQRQTTLRYLVAEARVTPQTVWNWRHGRSRPSYLYQLGIVKALKAATGESYSVTSLFP